MPISASEGLAGNYDYRLVSLSVLIWALASYAALDLGGGVTASRGSVRSIWLMGGRRRHGNGDLIDALHRNALSREEGQGEPYETDDREQSGRRI
jgi:NO-binding membrane sensor protein with MHYT domain